MVKGLALDIGGRIIGPTLTHAFKIWNILSRISLGAVFRHGAPHGLAVADLRPFGAE